MVTMCPLLCWCLAAGTLELSPHYCDARLVLTRWFLGIVKQAALYNNGKSTVESTNLDMYMHFDRVGGIDFRVNLFQSSLEIAIFRLY